MKISHIKIQQEQDYLVDWDEQIYKIAVGGLSW